jgi:tetratricopeptide (TPR) repeat protein
MDGPPPETWSLKEEALYQEFFLQLEEASRIYRRIIEIEPANADAHYSLAIASAGLDRCEQSIPYLKRAYALEPAYILGFVEAAGICEKHSASREAGLIIDAASELAPDNPIVADTRANLFFNHGQYEKAVATYYRVIELSDSPLAQAYLADALRLSGRKQEAVGAYQKAISSYLAVQDSFLPRVYWKTLGELLEELGNTRDAARCYQQFLDVFPEDRSDIASAIRTQLEKISRVSPGTAK